MHKKDFFPSYCFHISRFQIIFPCRDIGPATATLDPRPRHWTRDRDIGPATATLDPRPRHWTRDPRPATISQTQNYRCVFSIQYNKNAVKQPDLILTNTCHLLASSFNATANRTLKVLISGAPNDHPKYDEKYTF